MNKDKFKKAIDETLSAEYENCIPKHENTFFLKSLKRK